MQKSTLFPPKVIEIIQKVENVLNLHKITEINGYVTIKCAGDVKNDEFEANEFLATFTECNFNRDLQKIIENELTGVKTQFDSFEKFITQNLNGLKFNISHHSFF